MAKHVIESIRRKNRIAENIINRLVEGKSFLMVGHENPDEDCISTMVSFALLVSKFEKQALIYITGRVQDQQRYLLDICRHNTIRVVRDPDEPLPPVDTIVACDTPKPDMIAAPPALGNLLSDPSVIKIEFDHHIASDSDYIGDADFALVTEASSAAELVGYVALKLSSRPELLLRHHVGELFTRNLVLAILTGIIGDSQMGRFLKSNRERRSYGVFSSLFNDLLVLMTTTQGNLSTKEEVFAELGRLSASEKSCNDLLLSKSVDSGSTSYVVLDQEESRKLYEAYDQDTIVSVARSVADTLAERSGRLSLIAYYDCSKPDGLVQFRIRRSQEFRRFDLRRIIEMYAVGNGGGHEGAIGFRFERNEIADIHAFARKIIAGVETELALLPG